MVFVGIPALIYLGIVGWNRPEVQVETFSILNTHYTQKEVLARYVDSQKGRNILGVRVGFWTKKMVQKFPQIENVKVRMIWPNHIELTIIEKQPYLSVVMPNRRWIVAKDGTPLSQNPQEPLRGFCVYGLSPKWMTPRIHPMLLTKLQTIYDWVCAYPELLPMGIQIHHMTIATSNTHDEILLLKDHSVPIKIGPSDRLPEQLHALHVFWKTHQAIEPTRAIRYIDLRVPDRVVVRYGSTS
jgi:cell division septal protein FtsQ